MDAVEAKKAAALQTAIQQKIPAAMSGRSDTEHPSTSNGKRRSVEDDRPAPVYASQTEATDAFKAMLLDKKVNMSAFCFIYFLSLFITEFYNFTLLISTALVHGLLFYSRLLPSNCMYCI